MTDVMESQYLIDALRVFPSYLDRTFTDYMDDPAAVETGILWSPCG